MIKINEETIVINGGSKELFEDLVNLNIALMQDPDLMELNRRAITAAIKIFKNDAYSVEVNHFYKE